MNEHFTPDNTEGFTEADLVIMNEHFFQIMAELGIEPEAEDYTETAKVVASMVYRVYRPNDAVL